MALSGVFVITLSDIDLFFPMNSLVIPMISKNGNPNPDIPPPICVEASLLKVMNLNRASEAKRGVEGLTV